MAVEILSLSAVQGGWRCGRLVAAISTHWLLLVAIQIVTFYGIAYEIDCFSSSSYVLISVSREGEKHRKRKGGSSTPVSWLGNHTEGVIAAMDVWHSYRIRKSEPTMARKQKKRVMDL
ncbi:hypothetical protein Tco_1160620 [Tanacetum coccineum]